MSVSTEDRFAPPEANVADVGAPATGDQLAGRGTRLGAAILDALIAWGVVMVIMKLVPGATAMVMKPDATLWSLNLSSLLVGVPVFLVLQGWLLVQRGQTIGKMICKLRIVRSDGARVDGLRMLGLRYGVGFLMTSVTAVAMVYSLLDCLLIFRESRQCLHDTIADTKVIKL